MPKQTFQERFIEGLLKRGETEVKRTARRIVYTRTVDGMKAGFYYLGKSGSLRIGHTIAGSIPVTSKFKCKLLGIEGTI